METNTQNKRYGTILASVLLICILAVGTFLSTEQFYSQFSTQQDALQKTSRGDKYTVNELNNTLKKNEDKDVDLPLTNELFEGSITDTQSNCRTRIESNDGTCKPTVPCEV